MELKISQEWTTIRAFVAKLKGQGENVNLKKWNLNLATNARMIWIRGETQFLGGECETKKLN